MSHVLSRQRKSRQKAMKAADEEGEEEEVHSQEEELDV